MKYVKSCGAVVFTRKDGKIQYVIIRAHNGEYGFPKGHMELGETEQQTAIREIAEEVGLHPVLLDGFRKEVQYSFPNKPDLTKITVYFLAEYTNQQIAAQPEEIAHADILPFEEALCLLSFAESQTVLQQAHLFLTLAP